MNNMRYVKSLMIINALLALSVQAHTPTPALCIVAVADLYIIPMAPDNLHETLCVPDHQLLFNEVVTIIDEVGQQACITISQSFYQTIDEPSMHNTYWTSRSNLVTLQDLIPHFITQQASLDIIPEPLAAKTDYENQDTALTLKIPYYDPHSDTTYAAGTRFVIYEERSECTANDEYTDYQLRAGKILGGDGFRKTLQKRNECKAISNQNFTVWSINPTTLQPYLIHLPVHHCITYGPQARHCNLCHIPLTTDEKIDCFVQLLRQWATMPPPHRIADRPLHKFDASILILRAAQICDMPYGYQNALTAMQDLEQLGMQDSLIKGDLIWVPNGLAIVSSLEKNLVITLDYATGHDTLVEVSIDKLFNDIATFEELIKAHQQKKDLQLLAGNNPVFTRKMSEFKLLKINSLWE